MQSTLAITYGGQQFTGPATAGGAGQPFLSDGAGGSSIGTLALAAITPIAAYTILANITGSSAAPTAASTIQLGGSLSNSVNAGFTLGANITSGSNCHGFSDSSNFDVPGFAHCSFDSRLTLGSGSNTYTHLASFQALPAIQGGTLSIGYGIYSSYTLNNSSVVTNLYHHYADDTGNTAGTKGTCGSQIGLYCAAFTSTGTSYSVKSVGNATQFSHVGPLMLGATGAVIGGAFGLDLGYNVWLDPVRANYYPLTSNAKYCILEMHSPGTNYCYLSTGTTPVDATLATPVGVGTNISFRASDNCLSLGKTGPFIFGSSAHFFQFEGTDNTHPMLKVNGAALNFRLADDSADATITAKTQLASDNSTSVATTAWVVSLEGVASGIATLDGSGKLTSAQIPASLVGALQYQGTWNANTNSPTLVSSTGTKGQYYKVSVAGSTTIDTISQWNIGDTIVFDGTVWDKIDGISSEVVSVAGRTGIVTLTSTDVGLGSVTNDAQTKAAIVPNTVPSAGQILAGNAGGTAYAPVTMSGDATMTSAGVVTAGGNAVTLAGTQTLTNKRVTKRTLALSANSATPAINTDSYDVVHITAQTTAITSLTSSLTGTPADGDTLRISVTGTGAVALTFGTSFEASTVALPTTTSGTARLDFGFFWNSETSKWRCVAVA